MLLQIFSGASILLGLYVLLINFMSKEQSIIHRDTTYHIGCYDPDYHNNHSLELTEKLSIIKSKVSQSIVLNMYHSKAMKPNFDKDVRDVAKSFEAYLDHYYKLKNSNDENINYFNSFQLAKMDYQNCVANLKFDEQECLKNWRQYQNSLSQIQKLKTNIKDLVSIKQRNQVGLSAIILERPNTEDDEIQKNLSVRIKVMRQKIDINQQKIIQLRTSRNKIKAQFTHLDVDLNQLQSILQQCVTNQQLIRYCNKITKQIHKIEQITPKMGKTQLQTRISKKLLIINGLQSNIKKSRKLDNLVQVSRLQGQLEHQKNQLKLLQFQIQNFQTKEQARCAMCSEERIKQLRKNITDLRQKKNQFDANLLQIQRQINQYDINLGNQKKQVEALQHQKDAAISTQFCLDEECKNEQKHKILEKQRNLNQLKKQIIDKQVQFNFLKSTYSDKINNVKLYLEPIDKIMDCLRKKQYYEELKKRAPTQKTVDRKMIETKIEMVKQLHDFEL